MSGMTLSNEEMKHFGIIKSQVLSRRESLILTEPRLFIILCSVNEAEEIAKDHSVVLASPGRYDNMGRRGLEVAKKGTVLGPHSGFKQVPK